MVICSFCVRDDEVKDEMIDGNLILSRKVLLRSRQESLRKKEPRQPKGRWGTVINPALQELQPSHKIVDV